jgi:hypothetical protein
VGKLSILRLPVVSASAEHLVMGHLMRRNILTYKAPPNNEGYDLICIHPNPRHRPRRGQLAQVKVQVKSRYATDCPRIFPLRRKTLGAFDFLIAVFLNIGSFRRGREGRTGRKAPEFFTFPSSFIRHHHEQSGRWGKVRFSQKAKAIQKYRDDAGFEQIAVLLGVPRPRRA